MAHSTLSGSIFHSVALLEDVCIGCTACLKTCPTEAIRVREGKAYIIEERCTDCGSCIAVCPVHAKIALTTPLVGIGYYDYKVAILLPSLYSQFGEDVTPDMIIQAVKMLGFDEVAEVAVACREISGATKHYLAEKGVRKPQISFNCPAVVNLIRVRYPNLIDHLLPLRSPMALAARKARLRVEKEKRIPPDRIGIFALSGCPARMTRIRAPLTEEKSALDGAISVADVYGDLKANLKKVNKKEKISRATVEGIRWGAVGGEVKALKMTDCIYVDGVNNVIELFEEIEKGRLNRFNLLEARVCVGGCVGGPLMVDNIFLARNKMKKLSTTVEMEPPAGEDEKIARRYRRGDYAINRRPKPALIDPLASNPKEALEKMRQRKEVLEQLPGIDCGACGSPNCRALAEDVVQGRAQVNDCVFVLFEEANKMARTIYKYTSRLPKGMHGSNRDVE